MLAAVQRHCPDAYAYGEIAVEKGRATWKATDDYIRKNRNVLLAYLGACICVVAYVARWKSPTCALCLAKGMTVGFFSGIGMGIATVQNIELLDPFLNKNAKESDADSTTTSGSQLYGQIGPRPHLHTLGRAAYWALENLDAKVTRSIVLTIFVNTIFHATPIFPTTLGFAAGLVFGDEISYVAATEGEHKHDFSEELQSCDHKLMQLEADIDEIRCRIESQEEPDDIKKAQEIPADVYNSFSLENKKLGLFLTEKKQYAIRIGTITQSCENLRGAYERIVASTKTDTMPRRKILSIQRSIRRFNDQISNQTKMLDSLKERLDSWIKKWMYAWKEIIGTDSNTGNLDTSIVLDADDIFTEDDIV